MPRWTDFLQRLRGDASDAERQRWLAILGLFYAPPGVPPAFAGVEGANVVAGDVTIEQAGTLTTITASDGSILEAELQYAVALASVAENWEDPELTELLQERGVVPWMRDRIPLVYAGDRLVAVADLWIAEEAACPAGAAVTWSDGPALY